MPRQRNRPHDIFRWIDRSAGPTACWPWTGALNSKNMPYFTVDGVKHIAYRLAYVLIKGEGSLSPDQLIRHTCDNQACCNPEHHIPGTHQQNMDDMKARERHGLSRIVVRAIRKLSIEGQTYNDIAQLYGITASSVGEIVRGETHKEDA